MRLAVIPARGGSKRIPLKNIKSFCGAPIISRSIKAALNSKCFDRVIVSTDNEQISQVAKDCGAEVPFLRPHNLSDDYTGTVPVIKHAVDWFSSHGINFDHVCCIYATAPFLRESHLRDGLEALIASGADYVFSVTEFTYPIQRALRLAPNGRVQMLFPDNAEKRSQDLERSYHDAGQFYWGTSRAWQTEKPLLGADALPVFLSRFCAQDIDTPEDWDYAEILYRNFHRGESK